MTTKDMYRGNLVGSPKWVVGDSKREGEPGPWTAYGYVVNEKGENVKPWSKTFKNEAEFLRWVHGSMPKNWEIHGTE